jgi:hypothetical protein
LLIGLLSPIRQRAIKDRACGCLVPVYHQIERPIAEKMIRSSHFHQSFFFLLGVRYPVPSLLKIFSNFRLSVTLQGGRWLRLGLSVLYPAGNDLILQFDPVTFGLTLFIWWLCSRNCWLSSCCSRGPGSNWSAMDNECLFSVAPVMSLVVSRDVWPEPTCSGFTELLLIPRVAHSPRCPFQGFPSVSFPSGALHSEITSPSVQHLSLHFCWSTC